LEWTKNLAKIVYSCTACINCVEKCPISFSDDLVNMVVAAKGHMIEAGTIPAPVKDFLDNVQLRGNPYGIASKRRADWIEELDIPPYQGQDYLFYVGCEGSFDSRAQSAARATAKLFA
jgi:Fe-S oxidoreductase